MPPTKQARGTLLDSGSQDTDTQTATSETRSFPILRKRRQFGLVNQRQKDDEEDKLAFQGKR